jgi:HEAT repeat protein
MRRSPDFERFRYATGQGGPWTKDTIDTMLTNVALLSELTGPERLEAEDLAIAKLLQRDTRAAIPLADAGCIRAIPALRAMADDRFPPDRLRVATALLRLGDATGSDIAIAVLNHRDAGTDTRIAAAELLAEHSSEAGRTALRAARNDVNKGVCRAIRHLLHGPIEFGMGAYFVNVDAHDWANDELMSSVRAELPQALAQRGLARSDGPPEHVAFGPDEGARFGEQLSRNNIRFSGMVQDHFGGTRWRTSGTGR